MYLKPTMTSLSHPLRIAELSVKGFTGMIGITICPGKKGCSVYARQEWARDLDIDLEVIRGWGSGVVVTLLEDHEFDLLHVRQLPDYVRGRGMFWLHLPVKDVAIPDDRFTAVWADAVLMLFEVLRAGKNLLIHCRGGLGRSGLIAALLLRESGETALAATGRVREVRPGAIETSDQERYVMNYVPWLRGDIRCI